MFSKAQRDARAQMPKSVTYKSRAWYSLEFIIGMRQSRKKSSVITSGDIGETSNTVKICGLNVFAKL